MKHTIYEIFIRIYLYIIIVVPIQLNEFKFLKQPIDLVPSPS